MINLLGDILDNISSIIDQLHLSENVSKLAKLIIQNVFEKVYYVSKNKIGLASAAIYLAFEIQSKDVLNLKKLLPVSKKMLERNLGLLQKNLNDVDIYSLAKTLHGTIR